MSKDLTNKDIKNLISAELDQIVHALQRANEKLASKNIGSIIGGDLHVDRADNAAHVEDLPFLMPEISAVPFDDDIHIATPGGAKDGDCLSISSQSLMMYSAAAGPCDVFPPVAGCCGGGRAWKYYPRRGWLCMPQVGCP